MFVRQYHSNKKEVITMKTNLLVLFFLLLSAVLFSQNYGEWSEERDGISVRVFTEQKTFENASPIKVYLQVKNGLKKDFIIPCYHFNGETYLWETRDLISFSLFEESGKRVEYTDTGFRRFSSGIVCFEVVGGINRFSREETVIIPPGKTFDFLVIKDLRRYASISKTGVFKLYSSVIIIDQILDKEVILSALKLPAIEFEVKAIDDKLIQKLVESENPPSDAAEEYLTQDFSPYPTEPDATKDWIDIAIPEDIRQKNPLTIEKIYINKQKFEFGNEKPNDYRSLLLIDLTLKNNGNETWVIPRFGRYDMALWSKEFKRDLYPEIREKDYHPMCLIKYSYSGAGKLILKLNYWYDIVAPGETKKLKIIYRADGPPMLLPPEKKTENINVGKLFKYDRNDIWTIVFSRKIYRLPNEAKSDSITVEQLGKPEWLTLPPIKITLANFSPVTVNPEYLADDEFDKYNEED